MCEFKTACMIEVSKTSVKKSLLAKVACNYLPTDVLGSII